MTSLQIASGVSNLVKNLVPDKIIKAHGSSHALEQKIMDVICPVPATPKKRGRPLGSTNKNKTKVPSTPTAPKKRGRPLGSTNKNKTKVPSTPTAHKKRGRPLGSTNKNKTTDSHIKVVVVVKEPTKRGRRIGTKDQHTRKSKKATTAATIIQQRWRSR